MDRNFSNSVILGYGPTTETHCGACKGNCRRPLPNGMAYHCHDSTRGVDFVAGPACRAKISHDKRPLSAIPHFGSVKFVSEHSDGSGGASSSFTEAANACDLITDMSAWVQLRQRKLPALGFIGISFGKLDRHVPKILAGQFSLADATDVKRTYDSITTREPKWALENLQKCYDLGMQISKIEASSELSNKNKKFISGIGRYLNEKHFLSDKQINGLNNVAQYRGEPTWTRGLTFNW